MEKATEVSCAVRVPSHKKATAIVLLAQRVQRCRWWKKPSFCPIMTVDLRPDQQETVVTDGVAVYPHCRVAFNVEVISELQVDCCVKMKVKRGKKTIFKRAIDATCLLKCFQDPKEMQETIHIAVDAFAFNPLSVTQKVKTNEDQESEHLNIASSQALQELQLPQKAFLEGNSVQNGSSAQSGKADIKVDVELCPQCGKRQLPKALPAISGKLPFPVPNMTSPGIKTTPTPSPTTLSTEWPWLHYLDDWCYYALRDKYRERKRRLDGWCQTQRLRLTARLRKPIKCIRWLVNRVCGRTYPGRVFKVIDPDMAHLPSSYPPKPSSTLTKAMSSSSLAKSSSSSSSVKSSSSSDKPSLSSVKSSSSAAPKSSSSPQGFLPLPYDRNRRVVTMKKEAIKERKIIVLADDEPLISDDKMLVIPDHLQESEAEEAKREEEHPVLKGEEWREETKVVREGKIQDNNNKGKQENKEMLPSNAAEENKETNICEKEQESHETDREGEERATPPSHAGSADVGVARRVTGMLLKVALTVVVVLVFLDTLLPELPED